MTPSSGLDISDKPEAMGDTRRTTSDKRQATGDSRRGGSGLSVGLPSRAAPASPTQGGVFIINFIRHETVPPGLHRALVGFALVCAAANALVLVGLIGSAVASTLQWRTVQRQAGSAVELTALQQGMEQLRAGASDDLAKLNAVIARERERFPTGGKLAALTKTLPARTWITGLSGDRARKTLQIQATYFINPDAPYDLPTKAWITSLTADPQFGRDLEHLELVSSSRKTQGKAELFVFELLGEWQPAGESR